MKYQRKTYSRIVLRIRYDDKEVLEKLKSVPSKEDYIVSLIKDDIAKKREVKILPPPLKMQLMRNRDLKIGLFNRVFEK